MSSSLKTILVTGKFNSHLYAACIARQHSDRSSSNILPLAGASRGIGFGLVKHLLENIQGVRVVATARNLATSTQLTDLAKTYPTERLVLVQLDTASAESYKSASADLAAAGVTSLDALVANAGIGARYSTLECPVADALDNYNTNVVGSMLTVQAFHGLLAGPKVVAFVSSIMGSIHHAPGEDC